MSSKKARGHCRQAENVLCRERDIMSDLIRCRYEQPPHTTARDASGWIALACGVGIVLWVLAVAGGVL